MPSDHRRLKLVGPTVSVSATHARKGSSSTRASCRKQILRHPYNMRVML